MEETLLPGDHLLINKFVLRQYSGPERSPWLPFTDIERRDVVMFRHFDPDGESTYFVKRIIGLPGETIEIRAKQVFIDGVPLDEPYAVFKDPVRKNLAPRDNIGPLMVPAGHFFVLGDNRDRSYDSRFWGMLSRTRVVGRPVLIWWSVDVGEQDSHSFRFGDRMGRLLAPLFHKTRWGRIGAVVG